jgi:hypothetical protein
MSKEIQVTFTLLLDEEEEIKNNDFFFYPQHDGTPSIRKAKPKENWDGYHNSKTGEKSYLKIVGYKGLILHK